MNAEADESTCTDIKEGENMNFIDNSYHLLVYKLLEFLYGCLREDYEPADDSITPEAMHIKPGYFKYIIKHLLDADYIRKCIDCPYQYDPLNLAGHSTKIKTTMKPIQSLRYMRI